MLNLAKKSNLQIHESLEIEYSAKNPLSIMFDTNVWKRLIKNDDSKFNTIFNSIKIGNIKPFASDACLIEAIRKNGCDFKNERKKILSYYAKPSKTIKRENNSIVINISPNDSYYTCPDVLRNQLSRVKYINYFRN